MPSRISTPRLIGRDEALATLVGAIAASLEGAPAFAIVRGEAGIGKSRLAAEAIASLPAGTRAVVGECLDIGHAGLPYLPVSEVLRSLARSLPPPVLEQVVGPARDDLAVLVPELADRVDTNQSPGVPNGGLPNGGVPAVGSQPALSAPVEMTSGLAQARLFERVLGVLRGLAAIDPLVLVVEDVHWIDRATRDLLTFLARNLTDERIAIVLTVRDPDLPTGHPIMGWLAEIGRWRSTTEIEPTRLDRADVDAQLSLIAGMDLPPEVRDLVWHRSQGIPLFVEELYASGPDVAAAPRSAADALLVRVARLDPVTRGVVDAAAIAARPLDDRLLADVLDAPGGDIDTSLAAAIAGGVLEVDGATGRYRFRHELLREVVEQQLLPGTRRRLHERFARCLEARPDLADTSPAGAAGELAVHYAEAGLVLEAYRHSIEAATAAEGVHAYADALRHLERALALEPRLPAGASQPRDRVELRTRAADDADLAGAFHRALELTRAALDLVDEAEDPVTAGLLHSRAGYLQWSLGDGPAALASHEEAVRLVPAAPPTPERAKVLGSLGGALMGEGRWAESRTVCEAAIACAQEADAPAEESRARNMLGSDLVALGQLEAGLAELGEARRMAEIARRADMLIVAHYNLALNLIAADDLARALDEARSGLEVARTAGLERRFGQDLAALCGDALVQAGRLDEAAHAVADGIALDRRGTGTVYLAAVRARIAALRGESAAAELWWDGIDLPALDPDVAAFVAAVAAEAQLLAGRPGAATAIAEAGLDCLEGLDDVLWTAPLVALGLRGLAEVSEATPGRRPAEGTGPGPALERFVRELGRLEPRVTTASGRGQVALARGELALIDGRQDDTPWLAAIEAFDSVPAPLAAAYARLRAAEAALRTQGLRADVADLLGTAATAAGQAGARPLGDAIAALAARARVVPTRQQAPAPAQTTSPDLRPNLQPATGGLESGGHADGSDPYAAAAALGLSAREIEVLVLVTAGYTNGEIAERLFITRKTAAVHVTHILDKLGVANRVGAAMIGARVGLDRLAPDYGVSE